MTVNRSHIIKNNYNILDLPQKHTVGGGTTVVEYKYAADGRKLQENVTSGSLLSRRDYVGDFIYETGVLKRILFEGGYVYMNGSSRTYMFFLKDHLGSVRAVVSQMGAVQQTNEYYPFGDLFPTSGTDNSGNRFRFTGKELGAETGLYDFSARFLHPRSGRFTTLDPLAEKYPSVSPYAYCNCNPVNFVDPDGRREWPVNPTYNGYKRKNLNNYRNPRPNHNGIDINLGLGDNDLGAPVYATHEGIVTRKRSFTDDSDSGGNRIQITSIDGEISTYYMHLNTIEAYKEGDFIEEGALIGTIGGSGKRKINEYTPHLHYELKISGEYVNPAIDEDNLVDPQSFITPIYLGEINPAIVIDENINKLQRSFNVVLSVTNAIEIK